jgi:adenylate cyclase
LNATDLLQLNEWIIASSLAGMSEIDLIDGFCTRAMDLGLPLHRVAMGIDTLHPVHQGRIFIWQKAAGTTLAEEYGRAEASEEDEDWRLSPFYRMKTENSPRLRRRRGVDYRQGEFPIVDKFFAAGGGDYYALTVKFGEAATIGTASQVYSSWTAEADGFADENIDAIERIAPALAVAIKSTNLARIAETLVSTYLGKDAGQRVLKGNIERGVAERMRAVLWFSDLKGFTRIADREQSEEIIPLLNDYADVQVKAIHSNGGHVLKFMGDGILAIFDSADAVDACGRALNAADMAYHKLTAVNKRRGEQGKPVTRFHIGLHIGEVLYGNIGTLERLDFTVVGPAVNEVSRIEAMCGNLERDVVLSADFAAASGPHRDRLVSLGRYALRGVTTPRELFTFDAESAGAN